MQSCHLNWLFMELPSGYEYLRINTYIWHTGQYVNESSAKQEK